MSNTDTRVFKLKLIGTGPQAGRRRTRAAADHVGKIFNFLYTIVDKTITFTLDNPNDNLSMPSDGFTINLNNGYIPNIFSSQNNSWTFEIIGIDNGSKITKELIKKYIYSQFIVLR